MELAFHIGFRGKEHYRYVAEVRVVLYLLAEGITVLIRHHHVAYDYIGGLHPEETPSLLTVICAGNGEMLLKHRLHIGVHVRVILHHKDVDVLSIDCTFIIGGDCHWIFLHGIGIPDLLGTIGFLAVRESEGENRTNGVVGCDREVPFMHKGEMFGVTETYSES